MNAQSIEKGKKRAVQFSLRISAYNHMVSVEPTYSPLSTSPKSYKSCLDEAKETISRTQFDMLLTKSKWQIVVKTPNDGDKG